MAEDQTVTASLKLSDEQSWQAAQQTIQEVEETLRSISAESLTLSASTETAVEVGDRFEWTRLGN